MKGALNEPNDAFENANEPVYAGFSRVPVAVTDAGSGERVGEPVRAVVELGVGEAHVATEIPIDHRQLLRPAPSLLAQHVGEREPVHDVHYRSLPWPCWSPSQAPAPAASAKPPSPRAELTPVSALRRARYPAAA